MTTPIFDFLKKYAQSGYARLHMPAHKGCGPLGEALDITEVTGADALYEADGIIKESEENASAIFGASTFYSAEGSSLAIRGMVYLLSLYAASVGKKPRILATRNAHKSFISAVTMLDTELRWVVGKADSYISSSVTASDIRDALRDADEPFTAVYVTSPDYLGNIANIAEIAGACHEFGALLVVDGAHGAYLKFLSRPMHPIDLGADMCCASAHKTLPVLTGGAYLHVSSCAPEVLRENAKSAMAAFGSTSPSYLILSSLDRFNANIPNFSEFCNTVEDMKRLIADAGYVTVGDEPMKITIDAKAYGYRGVELREELCLRGVSPEFADEDFLVLMPSPSNSQLELDRVISALFTIPKRAKILTRPPAFVLPQRILSPRAAALSPRETVSLDSALGRVLANASVGCPPAIPIAVAGELIGEHEIEVFRYYGYEKLTVVR